MVYSALCLFVCFQFVLSGLVRATESYFRPIVHAGSGHGSPSLTSLPKDDEMSCELRPPRSPIRSLTLLDRAYLQSPDEDCTSHSTTHPVSAQGGYWIGPCCGVLLSLFRVPLLQ